MQLPLPAFASLRPGSLKRLRDARRPSLQVIYSRSSSFQSSSEVKALFSDVGAVAAKHCKEISKVQRHSSVFEVIWKLPSSEVGVSRGGSFLQVLMFQASHQSRLCSYYQQKVSRRRVMAAAPELRGRLAVPSGAPGQ